jgi:tRNA-dihydrouridine synthase B
MLKIGALTLTQPTALAPMAALTDKAFRQLVGDIGAIGLLVTEMISVEGLKRANRRTIDMAATGHAATPEFIQIFGYRPESFAECIRYINEETSFAGIDINMGCPVKKVIKNQSGAALLNQPKLIAEIVRTCRRATPLPLTVKIRLGFETVNVLETARIIADCGADALIVHFRLREEYFKGQAHWEWAAGIREQITIPLIGNGDIASSATAHDRLKECDGIMIGRGAIANPFIFREIAGQPTNAADWIWLARTLPGLIETYYPPKFRLGKLKALARYLMGHPGQQRDLKRALFQSLDYAEATALFQDFFGR